MGYLDGLDRDCCPFCYRALDDYISSESYAGKWVSIDVPSDLYILSAVDAKEALYRWCKDYNSGETIAKFNLGSLR